MTYEFGYEVIMIDGVEIISFDQRFSDYDKALRKVMPYNTFKKSLNEKGYSVKKEFNLFYKYLKGDRSGIEYETEVDAYIDCYIHANENGIKLFD